MLWPQIENVVTATSNITSTVPFRPWLCYTCRCDNENKVRLRNWQIIIQNIYIKTKEINCLIGKKFHLSIENKLFIYKAVIKSTWSYGIEMRGCTSKFNIVIMQRSQFKILRAITSAPRYVTNHTLHTDFNIPYVNDFIHERPNKHHIKPEAHPNPLLQPLIQPVNNRRLKRCWPFDWQGTWSDIAGWTPYHDILIHYHISI